MQLGMDEHRPRHVRHGLDRFLGHAILMVRSDTGERDALVVVAQFLIEGVRREHATVGVVVPHVVTAVLGLAFEELLADDGVGGIERRLMVHHDEAAGGVDEDRAPNVLVLVPFLAARVLEATRYR